MAETQFTGGPWEISHQNGDPEESFNGIIGPAQTNRLGKTYRTCVAQYVEPKNAHLIAAAPELYEALETCLAHSLRSTQLGARGYEDDIIRIRAILAKARGEAV